MARGWERQEQDAGEIRTPTERARLMLARTRALSDLQHACAPLQRAMLEEAIAALDRRLKAFD